MSGLPLLLIDAVPNTYLAAIGLFVFGLTLLSMAVGMGTVATSVTDGGTEQVFRSGGSGTDSPADD